MTGTTNDLCLLTKIPSGDSYSARKQRYEPNSPSSAGTYKKLISKEPSCDSICVFVNEDTNLSVVL